MLPLGDNRLAKLLGKAVLPPLEMFRSPNCYAGHTNPLGHRRSICLHRWADPPARTLLEAKRYYDSVNHEFMSSAAEASAHLSYGGSLVGRCAQHVALADSAWSDKEFNRYTINVESADAIWAGYDKVGFAVLARIVGWLCLHEGTPAVWTKDPGLHAGLIRHYDLRNLGQRDNNHTDPTTDDQLWLKFVAAVQREVARGGYRKSWAR